jgi:hypothetical protein
MHTQTMDLELAKRLKRARERGGFSDATTAARHFGWTVATYLAHENGSRGFGWALGRNYAGAFKVDDSWLMTGRGRPSASDKVPIAGYVGNGGIVYSAEETRGAGPIAAVDLPQGDYDQFAIFKMRGPFYFPAYRDNELVFARKDAGPPLAHLKHDCIVRTNDRRIFLRTIVTISDEGQFTLLGFNETAPLEIGLEWAFPVEWTRRP